MRRTREIKFGCCVIALLGAFAAPTASGDRTADPAGGGETTGPAATSDPAPPARGCRDAGGGVTELDAARARLAMLCLVNVDRRSRGLATVRAARLLERSAQGHSADMVQRRYFDHASPAGSTLTDRVKRAGYLRGVRRYSLGETLAYGSESVTLVELFGSLLASPPHRAIIRDRKFRELGVGTANGMPTDGGEGLTVTMNFGTVSGRV